MNELERESRRRSIAPAPEAQAESPYLPWLEQIRPYVPGKPPERVLRQIRLEEIASLASNENPLGPSPRALEAIQEALRELNRYPDDQAQRTKATLAGHYGVPIEQVVVGNGSNDLIELLVRITTAPGREVVMAEASFPTCRIAALAAGGTVRLVPLREDRHDLPALADAVGPRTHLVYVCNPNNPTGTMNSAVEVDAFLARLPPHVLAVFDEAYFEYIEDPTYPDLLPRILRQEQVVVLRTFSKCYSLASLRIGYGICPMVVAERLEKVRLPFNVNGIAQRAAIASIHDEEQVLRSRLFNEEGKGMLRRELDRLGVFYRDSVTNFFMVRVPWDGGDLYRELLQGGVVVRPLQSFGLPADHYRVTVGTSSENQRFIRLLERILRKNG